MTNAISRGAAPALEGYDDAQAMLARYPALSAREVAALKHWFDKRASAFEVASLASNQEVADSYAAFRTAHIDRFDYRDWIVMASVVAALVAIIVAAAMLS